MVLCFLRHRLETVALVFPQSMILLLVPLLMLAKTTRVFDEGSGIMPSPCCHHGWKETSRRPIQATHNRPRSFGSILDETYNREPLPEAFLCKHRLRNFPRPSHTCSAMESMNSRILIGISRQPSIIRLSVFGTEY
ncbi:hypothetical protein N431DRAFT_191478 [Stipitochalara longipes BDJ]|nr:hypothetical protein N431DRAFT_191478 [Stipitochalara longipes BDJ]